MAENTPEHVEGYERDPADRRGRVGRRVTVCYSKEYPDGTVDLIAGTRVGVVHAYRYDGSFRLWPEYWVKYDDGTEERGVHHNRVRVDGPEPGPAAPPRKARKPR
jgi:hypothetical protein